MMVELAFPVASGRTLPVDHGYQLYSALCRAAPVLHTKEFPWMLSTLPGRPLSEKNRVLALPHKAELRMRLPLAVAHDVAGKLRSETLEVDRHLIRLHSKGIVCPIRPSERLAARIVIIRSMGKYRLDADEFFSSLCKQLLPIVHGRESVQVRLGQQRISIINHNRSRGYEVEIDGLTNEESINIQKAFIGGRHHHGAGWFDPC